MMIRRFAFLLYTTSLLIESFRSPVSKFKNFLGESVDRINK